jgi:V/A-type H+-transporting ATPase subunit I
LYGTIGLSGATALFYNTPDKNIFLNFGSGLWATYNTVSGLVGDILSYIRLYAIGLTGALLGGVFNTMAIDMTASLNPFVRWLPMLLILLLGHALNIGISLISSFVHSLRLIYVEYYKNSEFEGGGIDYKPFRKI